MYGFKINQREERANPQSVESVLFFVWCVGGDGASNAVYIPWVRGKSCAFRVGSSQRSMSYSF